MLIEKGGKIMKNSKWKRISSMGIVAAIVLATGMSGCASENSQSSQISQTSEGTTTELTEMWENQKKMQEIIDSTSDSNKEVLNKGSVMEVVDLDELDVPFTLEFKTDGTYALKSDFRDDIAGLAHLNRVTDAQTKLPDKVLIMEGGARHGRAGQKDRIKAGRGGQDTGAANGHLDAAQGGFLDLRRVLEGDGPAREFVGGTHLFPLGKIVYLDDRTVHIKIQLGTANCSW